MFHLSELGTTSVGRCVGLTPPATLGGGTFPPDVLELHRTSPCEVTIGRVVFLPPDLAGRTGCFAVEFLTLTRERWYAWTPDDNVWEYETTWFPRVQSFEVFVHAALADHRLREPSVT